MHGATLARASALGARTTASSSSAATASRPAAPLRGVGAPGSRGGGRPGSLSRRRGVSIVAMAGRRKKQQKRKEKSSSSSPPASPSPASSGDPAASPASPSASTNDASPPRGPERLSQNDWAEIERQNAIAAAAKAAAPGPGPARDGILDKLLSSDAMLLFAVDGVCPELVNGRVAMFGFFTALIKELVTGQSFTTQLAYNLTHGVSPTIIALVLVGTLAPSFMADAKETPWTGGDGVARYNDDATAKGKRRYLCDPRALDVRFAPVAELWNGRAAMTGLILTFVIEGALGHGIFRA